MNKQLSQCLNARRNVYQCTACLQRCQRALQTQHTGCAPTLQPSAKLVRRSAIKHSLRLLTRRISPGQCMLRWRSAVAEGSGLGFSHRGPASRHGVLACPTGPTKPQPPVRGETRPPPAAARSSQSLQVT